MLSWHETTGIYESHGKVGKKSQAEMGKKRHFAHNFHSNQITLDPPGHSLMFHLNFIFMSLPLLQTQILFALALCSSSLDFSP